MGRERRTRMKNDDCEIGRWEKGRENREEGVFTRSRHGNLLRC